MTAKQSIAWLQAAWKDDKKRINLLLVSGLAGMLLLCMSEWLPAGQSTQNAAQSSQQSQTAAEYEQQLENRLAALIRAMDGAGETVVMVTLDCGEETTYAADTRTEKTSEDTRSSAASQRTFLRWWRTALRRCSKDIRYLKSKSAKRAWPTWRASQASARP